MIEAKITGDGKGFDHCDISIEEEYSENGMLHLFAQLKYLNDTVLQAMVDSGFDPNDMSCSVLKSVIGAILLHTITDFRTEHDITV